MGEGDIGAFDPGPQGGKGGSAAADHEGLARRPGGSGGVVVTGVVDHRPAAVVGDGLAGGKSEAFHRLAPVALDRVPLAAATLDWE